MDLRQERIEEDRRDYMIECNLGSDYDYFLDYYSNEIEELQEAYSKVKELHLMHGWDCSDYSIRELI